MQVWSAETINAVEGHTDIAGTGEVMEGSTVSKNPGTSVRPSFGTWEVFILPRQSDRGRRGKEDSVSDGARNEEVG